MEKISRFSRIKIELLNSFLIRGESQKVPEESQITLQASLIDPELPKNMDSDDVADLFAVARGLWAYPSITELKKALKIDEYWSRRKTRLSKVQEVPVLKAPPKGKKEIDHLKAMVCSYAFGKTLDWKPYSEDFSLSRVKKAYNEAVRVKPEEAETIFSNFEEKIRISVDI